VPTTLLLVGGFVALIGVLVGSFLNALVWRLHKGIPISGRSRSMCPNCERTLKWYDLIPVVSWVILKAHCRYCKEPISKQYPVVEVLTGVLWLISFAVLSPVNTMDYLITGLWLAALSSLIALAVYDIRWLELPDRLVAVFVGLAALHAILVTVTLEEPTLLQRLDPVLGAIAIAGLFYLLYQISNGAWIGGGDVKLAVGMGLFLGLQKGLLALFIASLFGSIIGIFGILVLGKSRKEVIPFGPFLISGTFVAYLFGSACIDWYIQALII
jgi:prepilin signal peptidase PulO-like enzyme (type II secretory pathway)